MTPQELKESIFQKAIHGTLVEQRVIEGSAKMSYETAKTAYSGGKKKEKFTVVEEDFPYDIPDTWVWVKLGEVCKIVNGFTPKKTNPEFWENVTIPWFTIDDVRRQGRFISETQQFISDKALSKNSDRIVPANTVLLCCTASVGEYAYTRIPLTTNQQFNALVIKQEFAELIDSLYIYQYVQTLKRQLISNAGKTTFNFLSVVKLAEFYLPLPPLAEQHRIVAKIEELLPLIDRYEKAYTRLENFNKRFPIDMQKSILQMAIQGKLVEQRVEEGTGEELYQQIQVEKAALIKAGKIKRKKPLPEITEDEIPFEIPDTWKWVSINNIAFVTKLAGFEYTKYMADEISPIGDVPIVRAKNIKPNCFIENNNEFISQELSEQLQRCALDERCVLMTFIGAGIGEVAIFENRRRYHLAPNVAKIVPHIDINDFLLYYLMSFEGRNQVFQYMKQTAQPSLSMETIRKVLVPLPPLAEQKRIVAKLEELLPLCERLT